MTRFSGRFSRAKLRPRTPPGGINKTEADYAELLAAQVIRGEISGWRFEAYRLRLADSTFYTPDFVVQRTDGTIELHEVKACRGDGQFLIEDDAAVKIKVAAQQYPEFGFVLCGKMPKKLGGMFVYKVVK